jgi:hypothetical protein
MRRHLGLALASALVAALVVGSVAIAADQRTPRHFRANLTERAEVPAPKNVPRGAGGTFSADLNNNVLTWTLHFDHLSGSATAAHIHTGAKGKAGPVVVPLCGPCKSGQKGTIRLTDKQISAISGRNAAYVNVHTVRNPAGEIRGQL